MCSTLEVEDDVEGRLVVGAVLTDTWPDCVEATDGGRRCDDGGGGCLRRYDLDNAGDTGS